MVRPSVVVENRGLCCFVVKHRLFLLLSYPPRPSCSCGSLFIRLRACSHNIVRPSVRRPLRLPPSLLLCDADEWRWSSSSRPISVDGSRGRDAGISFVRVALARCAVPAAAGWLARAYETITILVAAGWHCYDKCVATRRLFFIKMTLLCLNVSRSGRVV